MTGNQIFKNSINARRIAISRESYWQKLYNDYANQYQEDHYISGWSLKGLELRKKYYLDLFKKLSIEKTELILDLGCGSGVYSRTLRANGYNTISMDYAHNALVQAKVRDSLPAAKYISGDIYSLPFKNCTFNHVLCIGVFQSLTKSQMAIAEIKRIMNAGSSLVLITLNSLQIKNLYATIMHQSDPILINGCKASRLAAYNPFKFKRELENEGFEIIDLKPVHIFPDLPPPICNLLSILQHLPYLAYLGAISFMIAAKSPAKSI